jgi:putative phosphoribosyl transferase
VSSAVEITSPQPVTTDAGDAKLNGDVTLPAGARGLVALAHGSGSSRHSSRNRAAVLHDAKLGTPALDLLTEHEARVDASTAEFRFDIRLLARRVGAAVDWTRAADTRRHAAAGDRAHAADRRRRRRVVVTLNEDALSHIAAPKKELHIVPGATQLFEEPGALAEVARLARDWFVAYLR